jgi:hypothetical protein
MTIEKRVPLVQVGVRIDPSVRQLARALAREQGVRESDVYRSIIGSFFAKNVNKTDTSCNQKGDIS